MHCGNQFHIKENFTFNLEIYVKFTFESTSSPHNICRQIHQCSLQVRTIYKVNNGLYRYSIYRRHHSRQTLSRTRQDNLNVSIMQPIMYEFGHILSLTKLISFVRYYVSIFTPIKAQESRSFSVFDLLIQIQIQFMVYMSQMTVDEP